MGECIRERIRQNRIRFRKSLAVSNHKLIRIDGKPCLSTPVLLFADVSRSKILEVHVRHIQFNAHLALQFRAGQSNLGVGAKN